MSGDTICVAVRVRPFNSREIQRNSKLCIKMNPKTQQCTIEAPKGSGKKGKTVYFSHDGSKKKEVKQQRIELSEKGEFECVNLEDDRHTNRDVYNDLGKKILENAWQGGKSYSMVGYGEDLGIIPLICNELFVRIDKQKTEELQFKVQVSMIEIYNEQVRDLFGSAKKRPPGGLKVREHPKFGPYVQGLKVFPVKTYNDINGLMERGSKARTVAATNMNQTSSRAHTLFTIILTITEINREEKKAVDRVSKITLVDLAGSERAASTGAQGDRLKEGCAINQSLSALGNVISMLVKKGNARGRAKKRIFIPYRTSTLTWLLRESLGGNAKTIMVAALSPASINFEETFRFVFFYVHIICSTLKYADRAKQIKNKAVVNEDPNVTLIKGLRKELEDLKKKLSMTNTSEIERLMEQLKESQNLISRLQKSDEDGEQEKKEFQNQVDNDLADFGIGVHDSIPCISNLHPDELMNAKIIFLLKEEKTLVGRNTRNTKARIKLGGVSIKENHCEILNREGKLLIVISNPEAKTFLNGLLLEGETEIHHLDRIIFGSNHIFRVNNPTELAEMGIEKHEKLVNEYDYLFSQKEFAEKNGISSIMDESEQEKLLQKKIQEELEKINENKRAEEEKLEKEKLELQRKQKEMEEKFLKIKNQSHNGDIERKRREFENERKKQEDELKKQRMMLEIKRKKLLEETKKQEELQRRIREKEEKDRQRRRKLEKKLLELIPMVTEANDYAGELKKKMKFGVKLINFVEEDELGNTSFETDIVIDAKNLESNKSLTWDYEKFESRFYQMQPLYQNYVYQKEDNPNFKFEIKKEDDPFWDPIEEKYTSLGISMIYLKSLTHFMDMNIYTPIFQGNGDKNGELKCGIVPSTENGEELGMEYVPNPKYLIGKPLHFKIVIENARGLPSDMCKETYVQFKYHLNDEIVKTKIIKKPTRFPNYSFEKKYEIKTVSRETIDYLRNSAIKFEIFGKPSEKKETLTRTEISDKMLKAIKLIKCRISGVIEKKRTLSRIKTQEKLKNMLKLLTGK